MIEILINLARKDKTMATSFVVTTQFLENYGAHTEDGKFVSNNAYWKFKGGTDYLVSGAGTPANAMAFLQAYLSMKGMSSTIGGKEFPTEVRSYAEWMEQYEDADEDYMKFLWDSLEVIDVQSELDRIAPATMSF